MDPGKKGVISNPGLSYEATKQVVLWVRLCKLKSCFKARRDKVPYQMKAYWSLA